MNFEISEALVKKLLERVDAETPLGRRLAEDSIFHGRMIVPSRLFGGAELDIFHELCHVEGDRSTMLQVSALRRIHSEPSGVRVDKLEMFVPALVAYLYKDIIDGWMYRRNRDGVLLPWLVNYIRHVQPDEGASYVVVGLLANTIWSAQNDASEDARRRRSGMTNAIVFYEHDLANRTIPELLAERGYLKENEELKAEYLEHEQRFLRFQRQFGEQFKLRHAAFVAHGRSRAEFFKMKKFQVAKCVNDEEALERQFELNADTEHWRAMGVPKGFDRIPLHCYIYMFHLELHKNVWTHVENIEPYVYKPELRDKLILPDSHRDLIDILTSDLDVLIDDIVEGKSGGTIILCQGLPGLGKTLTAEVYSEVVGKPLYRVHSGQLGTTATSVEANLSTILQRAARWDAIMLLDEADVYIRRRDNDLQHNAIVAEFLRTLEYFNGLLFMTTNRQDDVDDAIMSRCIATIKYEVPCREDAIRIWDALATQFDVNLSREMINRLADTYTQASGRDIKELLKLTKRYCEAKSIEMSEDAFRQCAMFRGIR